MNTSSRTTSSLRLADATVAYGQRPVLDGFDFTVPSGRFTAVVGPNGCGKSTMLKSLARTLRPRAGAALLDDKPLGRWRSRAVAQRIALLPQDPVVPEGITVKGLVARGRHPYHSPWRQWLPGDDEAVSKALSATGVADLAEQGVEGLSGGQRQRVWIAMILAQDTEYVLLDARYADQLVVMDGGRVVAAGQPADVLTEELVAEVFGLAAEIAADPQSGTPMVVPVHRR